MLFLFPVLTVHSVVWHRKFNIILDFSLRYSQASLKSVHFSPFPLPLARIRPPLTLPSNFWPQTTRHIAARRRIFVKEAFDNIYLLLTFLLATLRIKSSLLTLVTSYILFHATAILSFLRLSTKTMFSCSIGFCTCSFLCQEHLPTSFPSLLQTATLSCSSGLISDATFSRRFGGGQGTGTLDAHRSVKQ